MNAEKALSFDNTNASTYGQLGIIYIKARNYEGAMPLLKCAVRGCTAEENEMGKAPVQGLALSSLSVAYYYVEYGTVLAFLSRPTENYCPEAQLAFDELRLKYSQDPILMSIVEDSEGLCRRLESGWMAAPAGTATLEEPSQETVGPPTPTPTPEPEEVLPTEAYTPLP